MTAIVGVIDTKSHCLVMGGDGSVQSDGVVIGPLLDYHPKVFERGPLLIGVTGRMFLLNLCRFGPWFSQEIATELAVVVEDRTALLRYLVLEVVPKLRACLEEHGVLRTDEDGDVIMGGGALLGCQGRLFRLSGGFDLEELGEYFAIGSGGEVACGALYALTHAGLLVEGRERVRIALQAAARHVTTVSPPLAFVTQRIPFLVDRS